MTDDRRQPDPDALRAARQALAEADRITVLTGAGISAESGVPTFRGADGLWQNRRAVDLATPQAFAAEPETVWEFYNWRRDLLSGCRPNPGHLALARLEEQTPDFCLITQNVDGLHGRAGSRNLIEIHGNLWVQRCSGCGRETTDDRAHVPYPPLCESCQGLLRPGVVWFGEGLDPARLAAAEQAAQRAQVFLVVGTSAVVYPAAGLTPLAKQSGARVIEVNLEPTPNTGGVDISLQGRAGEILPGLIAP